MQRALLLGPAVLLAACGAGGGGQPPPPFAGGCAIEIANAIGPHDAPLGFTAEEAAAHFRVRGDRLLTWSDTGASTALEVGIEAIDPDRVFHVVAATERIGDVEVPCHQGLTFPARVRFRTADGGFDERLEVDVFARAPGRQEWAVWIPAASLRGDVRWTGAPPEAIGFAGRIDAAGVAGGVSAAVDTGRGEALARVALWGEDPSF